MKPKIRLGILGAGALTQCLLDCYAAHPLVEFVGLADYAAGLAQDVAAAFHQRHDVRIPIFTSYEDMMRGAVMDALFIACDPDCQVDYAVDAMNRGIHVMTQVPAAFTMDQCWALVNTVRKTGVKYQLAEQARYWNFIRQWRNMANAGEFGKIYYAEGEYLHYEPVWGLLRDKKTHRTICPRTAEDFSNPDYEMSWRYRTFQNPIYYMPHELSPLLSITGGRIAKVSCLGTRLGSYDNPLLQTRDLQTALMYNTEDVIFSLRAGFTAPYGFKNELGAHWYQIKGSKATAETSRSTLDTMKLYRAGGEWETRHWGTIDPDAPEHIRNATHGGTDFYPIQTFVDAIVNDTTPAMDVYLAVESAAPAIMAAQSSEQGGALLEIPDFRP